MRKAKSKEIISSVIKTLVYSDIFDCPLRFNEIYKFYNGPTPISRKDLGRMLKLMVDSGQIQKLNFLYFLPGRKLIVEAFVVRRNESEKKLKIANRAVGVLKKIPTIKLIGVSGSLAVTNSKKNDDIDLFFITSRNTLWITRFFVNIVLMIYGEKRGKLDFVGEDKICPNMYLEESLLSMSFPRRNLFTAREIIQLKVLFDRWKVYENLLQENFWVQNFLPNIKINSKKSEQKNSTNKLIYVLNKFFYVAQICYMSSRITEEEVKPRSARFHPNDCMYPILELFNQRGKIYLEPLDAFDTSDTFDTFPKDTPGY